MSIPVTAVGVGDSSVFGLPRVGNVAATIAPQGWQASRVSSQLSVHYATDNGASVWLAFEQAYQTPPTLNVAFVFGGDYNITGVSVGDTAQYGRAAVANRAKTIAPAGWDSSKAPQPRVWKYIESGGAAIDFTFTEAYAAPSLTLNTPFYFGGDPVVSGVTVGDTSKFGLIQEVRKPLQITPVGLASRATVGKPRLGTQGDLRFDFTAQYEVPSSVNTPYYFGTGETVTKVVSAVGVGVQVGKFGLPGVVNSAKTIAPAGISAGGVGRARVYVRTGDPDTLMGASVDFVFAQDPPPARSSLNIPFYFEWTNWIGGQGWDSAELGTGSDVWLYTRYVYPTGWQNQQAWGNLHHTIVPRLLLVGIDSAEYGNAAVKHAPNYTVNFAAMLLPPITHVHVKYDAAVERPKVNTVRAKHQTAVIKEGKAHSGFQLATRAEHRAQTGFQKAGKASSSIYVDMTDTLINVKMPIAVRHQDGRPILSGHSHELKDGNPAYRKHIGVDWQDGITLSMKHLTMWQDKIRSRRPHRVSQWQEASPMELKFRQGGDGNAIKKEVGSGIRYQNAVRPQPGHPYTPPPPPPPKPCYIPNANLLFQGLAINVTPDLLFTCEWVDPVPPGPTPLAVIPVKKAYIIMNEVRLFKVGTPDVELPVLDFNLSIDMDSWTWGFSATLPGASLSQVASVYINNPVQLRAEVNGEEFLLLAEKVERTRAFGQTSVKVSGRGHSAYLSAPYSPTLNFANDVEKTAQQIMVDALTTNGVTIGWEVYWNITDWFVPGNVWSASGTYMDAVTNIANAVGAYVAPHPTEKILSINPRYPVLPWSWAAADPDIQLPTSVVNTESIRWEEKPAYTGVYVSGASQGILGFVKRNGTAGDFLAPMVTEALITEAVAARMRGGAILSDTGRMAVVTISLPVMPETGIIVPGKLVRYTDGGTAILGITKSVNLATAQQPQLSQTIELEVHGG